MFPSQKSQITIVLMSFCSIISPPLILIHLPLYLLKIIKGIFYILLDCSGIEVCSSIKPKWLTLEYISSAVYTLLMVNLHMNARDSGWRSFNVIPPRDAGRARALTKISSRVALLYDSPHL